jgi:hypothetical protein
MTLTEFIEMSPKQRAEWLESKDHWHNCAAWSEGLCCCLEKMVLEEGRKVPSV